MSCQGKPCGCSEQGLTTPVNTLAECAKEPCSEIFCEECITHCQPEISITLEGGLVFAVSQGARLDEVIQGLMLMHIAPECLATAPVGLRLVSKSQTSILLKWKNLTGSTYTIEYTDGITPLTVNVGSAGQYQFINLSANTMYTIQIKCNETDCYSVAMKIKTN